MSDAFSFAAVGFSLFGVFAILGGWRIGRLEDEVAELRHRFEWTRVAVAELQQVIEQRAKH